MRQTMDQYGQVVRKSEETNCLLVDIQAAFNEVLKDLYPATIVWDRVHPSATGDMVLALALIGSDLKLYNIFETEGRLKRKLFI